MASRCISIDGSFKANHDVADESDLVGLFLFMSLAELSVVCCLRRANGCFQAKTVYLGSET